MTAPRIRVEYEELSRIAQIFGGEGEQVAGLVRNLKAGLEVLRRGDWVGPGANAFYAEMDGQVLPSLARINAAMSQAQNATLRVRAVIQEAETEAARVLNALPGNAPAVNAGGANPSMGSGGASGGANAGASFARNPSIDDVDVSNVTYRKVPGELFVDDAGNANRNGVSPNDVTQGQLGDCYFLSSLAAVAAQNPDLIRNMIQPNPDGTYTVTFKKQDWLGNWHDEKVTVDGELPVRQSLAEIVQEAVDKTQGKPAWDFSGRLAFAKAGDFAGGKPELWVAIVEKAYAKQAGGYDEIEGGWSKDVLPMITGQRNIVHDPEDLSFGELSESFKKGSAITLESRDKGKDVLWWHLGDDPMHDNSLYKIGTLIPNHTYYVVGVDEVNKTVIVKNPWGWGKNPTQAIPFSDVQGAFREIVTNDGTRK